MLLEDPVTGKIQTKCECTQMNTVTVVEDTGYLFTSATDNLEKVFSAEAIAAIAAGRFLQTYLFYVLCLQTALYLYFLVWSWGQDIKELHTKEQKSAELYKVQKETIKIAQNKEVIVIEKPVELEKQLEEKEEQAKAQAAMLTGDPQMRAEYEKQLKQQQREKYKKKLLEDSLFSDLEQPKKKFNPYLAAAASGNNKGGNVIGIAAAQKQLNPRLNRIMQRRLSRAEQLSNQLQKNPDKAKDIENNVLVKKGILKQVQENNQAISKPLFKVKEGEYEQTKVFDANFKFDLNEEGMLFQQILQNDKNQPPVLQ